MLVDLGEENDLGRVCDYGTVRPEKKLMTVGALLARHASRLQLAGARCAKTWIVF